ncbi:lytic transglycosylase domain-containing protein, partial [Klebsiella pneumoniae]|nr:traL protein [Klebsiella pneumoniae]
MSKHPKLLVLALACLACAGRASAAPASDEVARLAQRCAPDVSPLTMAYIVGHESSNGPYRININGGSTQLKQQPRTEAEAVSVSKVLLKDNKSFDMGLAQINSNGTVAKLA